MRWTTHHSTWLAQNLVKDFEKQDFIKFLRNPQEVKKEIFNIISQEFQKEKDLEAEVQQMLNELEKQSSFDRQKMYSMLKKKLAEKKGLSYRKKLNDFIFR